MLFSTSSRTRLSGGQPSTWTGWAQNQKGRLTYKTYLASHWTNHLSVSLPWANLNQSDQQ